MKNIECEFCNAIVEYSEGITSYRLYPKHESPPSNSIKVKDLFDNSTLDENKHFYVQGNLMDHGEKDVESNDSQSICRRFEGVLY